MYGFVEILDYCDRVDGNCGLDGSLAKVSLLCGRYVCSSACMVRSPRVKNCKMGIFRFRRRDGVLHLY